jgi:hypothetical protein
MAARFDSVSEGPLLNGRGSDPSRERERAVADGRKVTRSMHGGRAEPIEKPQFLEMVEGILELQPRTLEGRERLGDFEQWDSIAILDYIATVDRCLGLILSVDEMAGCQTFDDLFLRLNKSILQSAAL